MLLGIGGNVSDNLSITRSAIGILLAHGDARGDLGKASRERRVRTERHAQGGGYSSSDSDGMRFIQCESNTLRTQAIHPGPEDERSERAVCTPVGKQASECSVHCSPILPIMRPSDPFSIVRPYFQAGSVMVFLLRISEIGFINAQKSHCGSTVNV